MSHHSLHDSPFDLSNKTAFVTGGNGGIGLGIAQGFIEHGANVAIAARNADKLESAVASLTATAGGDSSRVLALSCDVTDRASIQAALDETMSKPLADGTSSSTTPAPTSAPTSHRTSPTTTGATSSTPTSRRCTTSRRSRSTTCETRAQENTSTSAP